MEAGPPQERHELRRGRGPAVEHLLRVRAVRVLPEAHSVLREELARALRRLKRKLGRDECKP